MAHSCWKRKAPAASAIGISYIPRRGEGRSAKREYITARPPAVRRVSASSKGAIGYARVEWRVVRANAHLATKLTTNLQQHSATKISRNSADRTIYESR